MESIKQNKKYIAIVIIFVIGIFLGAKLFFPKKETQTTIEPKTDATIATAGLNSDFEFPLKDSFGKELSTIKINASNAVLKSEVIIKGSRSVAQNNKAFLTIDLEITNDYNKSIDVNTRNYFRLKSESSDSWLAPDIHNDPVKVQAISTKQTRIGYIVNESDKKYILRIGEIDGEKQEVQISF